jgi:hypothetical protein
LSTPIFNDEGEDEDREEETAVEKDESNASIFSTALSTPSTINLSSPSVASLPANVFASAICCHTPTQDGAEDEGEEEREEGVEEAQRKSPRKSNAVDFSEWCNRDHRATVAGKRI